MPYCSVPRCTSSSRKNPRDYTNPNPITFHRYPPEPELRSIWIEFAGGKAPTPHSTVCSKHFEPGFIRNAGMR